MNTKSSWSFLLRWQRRKEVIVKSKTCETIVSVSGVIIVIGRSIKGEGEDSRSCSRDQSSASAEETTPYRREGTL